MDRTIAIAQPLQGGNQMALRRGEGPGHSGMVTTLRTTLFYCTISTLLDRIMDTSQKASGSGEASHLGHHGREHLPLPQVEPAYQETRGEGAPHPGAGSAMAGKIKKSLAVPKVRSSHLPSSNIAARRLRTAQPQQTGSRATGEGHRGVHPPLGLEPQVLLRPRVWGTKPTSVMQMPLSCHLCGCIRKQAYSWTLPVPISALHCKR